MATLLHHIQPLMSKSISKAEERIKKKIPLQTELEILLFYQRLDASELRVLARPAPTIELTTLEDAVVCLRAELDAILDA